MLDLEEVIEKCFTLFLLLLISLLVQTGSSLKEQRLCLFHLGVIHVSHYVLSGSVMANSL